jgi:hypothetical protein
LAASYPSKKAPIVPHYADTVSDSATLSIPITNNPSVPRSDLQNTNASTIAPSDPVSTVGLTPTTIKPSLAPLHHCKKAHAADFFLEFQN